MKKRKKRMKYLLCIFVCALAVIYPKLSKNETASAEDSKTAVITILETTDIHGQVTCYDYEKKKEYRTGGLSKVATLIQSEREANPNTLLFDNGDYFFDFATNRIAQNEPKKVQPVLSAMKLLNYDAITIGNHEFDYGYKYLLQQLKDSGMYEKAVCANVQYYAEGKEGKDVFLPSKMITKQVIANDGSKITVKIGVFGITQPQISAKAYSHYKVLATKEMVQTAKEQAKALRAKCADIVVGLIHSGVGNVNAKSTDENIVYEISKCSDIDVILAGHTHETFPVTGKGDTSFNNMPFVDSVNGLMNGKAVVIGGTRGQNYGKVDVTISKDKKILSMKSSAVRIEETVVADEKIEKTYEQWVIDAIGKEVAGESLLTLQNDEVLANYFTLLEDNELIQLENDAKTAYALSYINEKLPQYKNLPIIAVSKNICYGKNGTDDYVVADGRITEDTLYQMQKNNGVIRLYKVKGSLLREWLEWSASAYENAKSKGSYDGRFVNQYLTSTKDAYCLLIKSYFNNWKNYYMFDGINFTYDMNCLARYNFNGQVVNKNGGRIGKIYYNGRVIKDTEDVIIVCERANGAIKWLPNDKDLVNDVDKGDKRIMTFGVIEEYVKNLSKLGAVTLGKDNNWNITAPEGTYVFNIPLNSEAEAIAKNKSWYVDGIEGVVGRGVDYLIARLPKEEAGVNVVLASSKKNVLVQTSSKDSISKILYLQGEVTSVDDSSWSKAKDITKSKQFLATKKGTYTVLAINSKGKKALKSIVL